MREIGHGAYGTVYLGTLENRSDLSSNEYVAVKVCRRSDVGDERYERELRGAKLYRSIPPQEGLVRIRDLGEAEWGFYTVMDLADDEFGGPLKSSDAYRPKTLARVIEGEKAMPLMECVKLALSLAKGLAALQCHHLLHRDIKPGNVLYVKGQPVLSDPGLLVEESDAASQVGTTGYVPPEKFTDAASDIYSLGLTLKVASFGRQVEDLDKGPAMEAETDSAFFPAWWRILNKATDPTPSRRYQSAKALLKDLKVLWFKMALASYRRSWMSRKTITIGVLVLIAYVLVQVLFVRFWENGARSFHAWSQSYELIQSLRFTKVSTYDTNLVARVEDAQTELAEIGRMSERQAARFDELKEIAEEKSAKGRNTMWELLQATIILNKEAKLQQRILEIGRRFNKKWKPSF